jgi:hypothetical protein
MSSTRRSRAPLAAIQSAALIAAAIYFGLHALGVP